MSLAEQLNLEHPEFKLRKVLWERLGLIFTGGDDLKREAVQFLLQRPKEPKDIYAARANRFNPQNILGTVISWYVSALWKKDIAIDRSDEVAGADNPDYYSQFFENCDMGNTKFTDLWTIQIENALLYKRSFVLIDLPSIDEQPGNYKAQRDAGALDAYLVSYRPSDVINWSLDQYGNLLWAVIKTRQHRQEFLKEAESVTRWWYFDRQEYRLYESIDKAGSSSEDNARFVRGGAHSMTQQQRVPLFCLEMQDSHWLGNRMYLQAVEHMNQDNSYAWALFTSNIPLPVFKTDKELSGTVFSENSVIHLAPGEEFTYAEPSGVSFEHSARRVEDLREELYRSAYVIDQGRSSKATPAAQSGYSKEIDKMPSKDVLNAVGAKLRAAMKEVLQAVAEIRGDQIKFAVRGFNFEESDAAAELALLEDLEQAQFPSETVRKFQMHRAARAIMADAPETEKAKAAEEIDAAPTLEEQQQLQLAAQQDRVNATLNRATSGFLAAAA